MWSKGFRKRSFIRTSSIWLSVLPEWTPSLLSCSPHLDEGFYQERPEARETTLSSDLHHTVHRASRPSEFEAISLSITPCGSRARFGGCWNHLCEDTEIERDLHSYIELQDLEVGHGHLSRLQNPTSSPPIQELRSISQRLISADHQVSANYERLAFCRRKRRRPASSVPPVSFAQHQPSWQTSERASKPSTHSPQGRTSANREPKPASSDTNGYGKIWWRLDDMCSGRY